MSGISVDEVIIQRNIIVEQLSSGFGNIISQEQLISIPNVELNRYLMQYFKIGISVQIYHRDLRYFIIPSFRKAVLLYLVLESVFVFI